MSEIRSIIVKDYLHHFEEVTVDNSVVKPGYGVNMAAREGLVHYGDGAAHAVALPDIGASVDTAFTYDNGQKIATVWIPQRGDIGYVMAHGDFLTSGGLGYFVDGVLEAGVPVAGNDSLRAFFFKQTDAVNITTARLVKVMFL